MRESQSGTNSFFDKAGDTDSMCASQRCCRAVASSSTIFFLRGLKSIQISRQDVDLKLVPIGAMLHHANQRCSLHASLPGQGLAETCETVF